MAVDPNHDAKQAFSAHWAGVTTTRSSPTFDGVPPNHDHFVVIPDPSKRQAKPASTRKGPSASAARKALRASIPVTYA